MGEFLEVDPIDLRMSSDHMDMHHAEIRAAHAAADGEIEGAAGRLGRRFRCGLAGEDDEWQATTTKLCGDIAAHGAAFKAAADGYTQNDANSAEALDRTL